MPRPDVEIENKIIDKLVSDALAKGYAVSVDDGGEIALSKSTDKDDILDATRSTDEDYLHFHHADKRIGMVWLVYGNGWDVISDHTDNAQIVALVAGANALAEELAQ